MYIECENFRGKLRKLIEEELNRLELLKDTQRQSIYTELESHIICEEVFSKLVLSIDMIYDTK
jgi:hypothetical protein